MSYMNLPLDKMNVKDECSGFVMVMEEHGRTNDAMELPCETDGTLSLETLQTQFTGATGLKYKHGERYRAVRLSSGYLHPIDTNQGWGAQRYFVTYPKELEKKRKAEESLDLDGQTQRKKVQETGVKQCRDLILLNLPFKMNEVELKDFFEREIGEVATMDIKRDQRGTSRGYGFIRFRAIESQVEALSRRHFIEGRFCDIKIPQSQTQVQDSTILFNRVFVGNISPEIANVTILKDHFNKYGNVTDVFLPDSKTCAFITFENPSDANKLIGSQHEIDGHTVKLNSAVPKPTDRQKAKELETAHLAGQHGNNMMQQGGGGPASNPPNYAHHGYWGQQQGPQGGGWGNQQGWGTQQGGWNNQPQQQQQPQGNYSNYGYGNQQQWPEQQNQGGYGNRQQNQGSQQNRSYGQQQQQSQAQQQPSGDATAQVNPEVLAQALQTVMSQYPKWFQGQQGQQPSQPQQSQQTPQPPAAQAGAANGSNLPKAPGYNPAGATSGGFAPSW